MNKILIHSVDEINYAKEKDLADFHKKYFKSRQNEGIGYLIEDFGVNRVVKVYFNGFYTANYLSEIEWSKQFWHYATELTRIIFDLSLNIDKEITLDYNGKQQMVKGFCVDLEKYGSPAIYNCWNWVKWAQQAIITRDNRQINNLLQIDTETMFSKIAEYEAINPDKIDPVFHEFYFQLLKKDYQKALLLTKDLLEKITVNPEKSFKNYTFLIGKKYQVDYLLVPYFKCMESVLETNQEKFDRQLFEALQKHKEWAIIKADPKDIPIPNSNNPEGFVSIPLLAACSLAYDKGMTINVKSDYIPEWLYKNFSY